MVEDALGGLGVANPDDAGIPRAVGACLRAWRHEAKLTIREVAKLSGLSVSFISMVERGETEIAFTRLVRLTDVFGRPVSDVTSAIEGPPPSPSWKVGADSGVRQHTLAGGAEMVYVGEPDWRMQPFKLSLQPGAVHGPVVHSYEEIVLCLSGAAAMVLDGETIAMDPGDVLQVPANTQHAYANASAGVVLLFTVDLRPDMEATLRTWAEVHRQMKAARGSA